MTGDITRLADRAEALWQRTGNDEAYYIADELRAIVRQQGKAGGVALDYVPGLLDQTYPPKVWLQIDTSGDNDDRDEAVPESCWGDLTWCYESIGGQEVVYIRADLVPRANPPEAGVTDAVSQKSRQLIVGFMLDCNAIGMTGAAENLGKAIKEYAAHAPQPKDAS